MKKKFINYNAINENIDIYIRCTSKVPYSNDTLVEMPVIVLPRKGENFFYNGKNFTVMDVEHHYKEGFNPYIILEVADKNPIAPHFTLTDADISWLSDYIRKNGVFRYYIDPWHIDLLKSYLSLINGIEYNVQTISDEKYIAEILDKSADSEQLKNIKCCNYPVLSIQTAIQETCKALDFYSQFKTENIDNNFVL